MEKTTVVWGVVRAYNTGGCESTVLTIPARLCESFGISPGEDFTVKTDEEGRIIYEPREESP